MAFKHVEAPELEGLKIDSKQASLVYGENSEVYRISYKGASLGGRPLVFLPTEGKWVDWRDSERYYERQHAIELAYMFADGVAAIPYDEIDQSDDSPKEKRLFT